MEKDKVFMSWKGKRIWYRVTDDGEIVYMVARGDRTDEYFTDWQDAIKWIDERSKNNGRKNHEVRAEDET